MFFFQKKHKHFNLYLMSARVHVIYYHVLLIFLDMQGHMFSISSITSHRKEMCTAEC